MIFVFSIGWSNYTPYLAKEIIGNTLKKCSTRTRVIDLNNYFFNELLYRADYYIQNSNAKFNIIEQMEILTSSECIDNFDAFLLAKENVNQFLLNYSKLDKTMSISLDGITFNGVTDNIYKVNLDDILDYVVNERSLLLNRFFSNDLIMDFLNEDIIAFSVTSLGQFVTTLYLSNILRKRTKKVKIIMGGNYLSRIYDGIVEDGRVFELVDYLVKGCGEEILPMLYGHIKTRQSALGDIPNIAYFDSERKMIVKNDLEHKETFHESAFGVENCKVNYYLPKKVVPMYITRGCAWKKCAFCSIPNISGRFRIRSITDVISDIKKYVKYGVIHFSFIDEALTPFLMSRLSDEIQNEKLNIRWGALARFDGALDLDLCKKIYAAGCRRLQFGLESYNEDVLLKMNKGIDYKEIKNVIQHCIQCGISINLFCMIGFPGETEQEAKKTVDFVLGIVEEALHKYGILVTADFSAFLLDVNSKMYYNQKQYGIVSEPVSDARVSLYTQYQPVDFDKNAVVYDAEQRYSKIIYDYLGRGDFEVKEPLYISETYWFLKACQMEN